MFAVLTDDNNASTSYCVCISCR